MKEIVATLKTEKEENMLAELEVKTLLNESDIRTIELAEKKVPKHG